MENLENNIGLSFARAQAHSVSLSMNDLIYIGITVAFFIVGGLYLRLCEKL